MDHLSLFIGDRACLYSCKQIFNCVIIRPNLRDCKFRGHANSRSLVTLYRFWCSFYLNSFHLE